MKKSILVLIIILSIFTYIPNVHAAEVLSVNAEESTSGLIKVSGTVENTMVATAVMVYDESGTNLITMKTTQVSDNNSFNASIKVASGNYVVKVADYNGGSYKTLALTPGSSASSTNSKVPATGDNIILYVVLSLVSITGLVGLGIHTKKKIFN